MSPPAWWEFVDELAEPADLVHQRILDLLHAHAAHDARDQRRVRVERRVGEEALQARLARDVIGELRCIEAGEPEDHLFELGLRASLPLDLLQVERVDGREARGEDAVRGHVSVRGGGGSGERRSPRRRDVREQCRQRPRDALGVDSLGEKRSVADLPGARAEEAAELILDGAALPARLLLERAEACRPG
jgi:hypothetical protein